MAHLGKDNTVHTLTSGPGGMGSNKCNDAKNSGKSGTSSYGGSNNVAMHPISKVKSKSSPNKR